MTHKITVKLLILAWSCEAPHGNILYMHSTHHQLPLHATARFPCTQSKPATAGLEIRKERKRKETLQLGEHKRKEGRPNKEGKKKDRKAILQQAKKRREEE